MFYVATVERKAQSNTITFVFVTKFEHDFPILVCAKKKLAHWINKEAWLRGEGANFELKEV